MDLNPHCTGSMRREQDESFPYAFWWDARARLRRYATRVLDNVDNYSDANPHF
jgi:hypothetical protein